jgi:hypothetical protein
MEKLINSKELCKQIKFYGKHGFMIWAREEKQHFITNRHFLVRYEELPREVLAALFGVFYKIPAEGETINAHFGEVAETQSPIDFTKIYLPDKQNIVGEVTPFTRENENKYRMRVLRFNKRFAYVNENYIKMAADQSNPTSVDNPLQPVYLAGGNILILPYRYTDDTNLIDDLLGDELNATTNTP